MLIMQVVMCNVKCLLKERGLTGNGSDCLLLCCNIAENGENLFLINLYLISGTKFFKGGRL